MKLEGNYGPKMTALNERQRRFVEGKFMGMNAAKAAEYAGYSAVSYDSIKVQGHRLMHDDRILAAMREYAEKAFKGEVPACLATLVDIRDSPISTQGDRAKATLAILDRSGFHSVSEHKTTVEHLGDDPSAIKRIAAMAKALGLDPQALLGRRLALEAPVIDAEPVYVVDNEDNNY